MNVEEGRIGVKNEGKRVRMDRRDQRTDKGIMRSIRGRGPGKVHDKNEDIMTRSTTRIPIEIVLVEDVLRNEKRNIEDIKRGIMICDRKYVI